MRIARVPDKRRAVWAREFDGADGFGVANTKTPRTPVGMTPKRADFAKVDDGALGFADIAMA